MSGKNITALLILLFLSFLSSNTLSQEYIQDTLAVRAILDSNGLDTIPVKSVSDSSGGRIVKLDFFKKNVTNIPSEIGNLTALKDLSFYSNSLKSVPSDLIAKT